MAFRAYALAAIIITKIKALCGMTCEMWMVQYATGRRYKRQDRQDSGGVHDNSKRYEELERTGALFHGLRPSAMKMENDDNDGVII